MKTTIATAVVACILLIASATQPSLAAQDMPTVKVALTDMSSTVGMCPDCQSMMGQGMMRPGMMGQGMMGQGMMGQGMMGQGMMMGMMAIRIDHDSVKAGPVKFEVTNWSRGMVHEMLIVAVDNPNAPLPYDYSKGKVAEDQVKTMGETAELAPNMSKTLEVTLPAGSFLLICNVAGHYAAGMATPFLATP